MGMAEGKDETACEKVANTAIKAIVDHDKSKKTHTKCTEELQTVSHEKVDFGKISYSQLDENQCKATFFNSPSFVAQHKKVSDKKTHCTKLDGETAGLKKAIGDATEAACKERDDCEKAAAAARDKTFNDSHAACSSQKNKDAFTRAHHMLCVLKGTSLQGCNVPTFQGVKKTAMDKLSCEVDVGTGCHTFGTNTYYMEGRCGGDGSSNPKYSFKIVTDHDTWDGSSAFNLCQNSGYMRLCDYKGSHYEAGNCINLQGCSHAHW